jgi:putative hydrolase of the HAD superfamily
MNTAPIEDAPIESAPVETAPVETVLLDVGGVLVVPNHELVGRVAREHGGRPVPASLGRAHYEGVAAAERPGGFVWDDYRRAVLATVGVPPDALDGAADALGTGMEARAAVVWTTVLPWARTGLAALGATGASLAVVSNSDGTVEDLLFQLGLAQVGPGPGQTVRAVVDSGAVGVEKPDPRIFEIALELIRARRERCVYVGDTVYADVDGATRAGIRPLHLDPVGWCRAVDHEHVADLSAVATLITGDHRRGGGVTAT